MVKPRKIPMEKRKTKEQRAVTFSKRKKGLFSKGAEYCKRSGSELAILVTSLSSTRNKVYSYGYPSVEAVIDKYLEYQRNPNDDSNDPKAAGDPNPNSDSVSLPVDGFFWEPTSLEGKTVEELNFIEERLEEGLGTVTNILLARRMSRTNAGSNPETSSKAILAPSMFAFGSGSNPNRSANDYVSSHLDMAAFGSTSGIDNPGSGTDVNMLLADDDDDDDDGANHVLGYSKHERKGVKIFGQMIYPTNKKQG